MTHHVSIEFLLALLIRFVSFVCIMWKHILWILIILQKEAFSRFRYPTSFHLQVFTYWNKLWHTTLSKKMSFHIIHILVLDEDSSHWRQVNTWTYKYTNMIDLFGFFFTSLIWHTCCSNCVTVLYDVLKNISNNHSLCQTMCVEEDCTSI